MTRPRTGTDRLRRLPHGFSLLDGLIGMTLMAVGLLGLARLESGLIAHSSASQTRLTAAQLSDQLLSTVLVDATNATCYTVPAAGTAWRTQALAALPGSPSASAVLNTATQRMTVQLQWTDKTTGDTHLHEASTDVR